MIAEQIAIKSRARGWHRTMALPKIDQAIQYRGILKALGNQTCAPLKTKDGYVVKFRPKLKKESEPGAKVRTEVG